MGAKPTIEVATARSCDVHVVNQKVNEKLAEGWELRGDLFVVRNVDNSSGYGACNLYVQQLVRARERK